MKYDALARYRPSQDGKAIDDSGEIIEGGDADGKFASGAELARRLASSKKVRSCITEKVFQYALGRLYDPKIDSCELSRIDAHLQQNGNRLSRAGGRRDLQLGVPLPHGRELQMRVTRRSILSGIGAGHGDAVRPAAVAGGLRPVGGHPQVPPAGAVHAERQHQGALGAHRRPQRPRRQRRRRPVQLGLLQRAAGGRAPLRHPGRRPGPQGGRRRSRTARASSATPPAAASSPARGRAIPAPAACPATATSPSCPRWISCSSPSRPSSGRRGCRSRAACSWRSTPAAAPTASTSSR